MRSNEDAVSEIIAEIFVVSLVMILGVIIFVMVFGVMPMIPKTPYLATDVSVKQMPGYSAIALHHRGGDSLNFTKTGDSYDPALLYVDTSIGSYQVFPGTGSTVFRPGDTIYIYYNGTGYSLVSSLTPVSGVPFPAGIPRIRIVDSASGFLLLDWGSVQYSAVSTTNITVVPTANTTTVSTPLPTTNITAVPTTNTTTVSTPIPTTNITAVPTANTTTVSTPLPTTNITAVPTANITTVSTTIATPTPTATAPVSTRTVTVKWSPSGYGYGSESPPIAIFNGKEILVPRGSSKTIYFVPTASRAVLNIKLDGTTVYTGSSSGSTISYTITNIVEDRTIIATFG